MKKNKTMCDGESLSLSNLEKRLIAELAMCRMSRDSEKMPYEAVLDVCSDFDVDLGEDDLSDISLIVEDNF
jgi:hypothetical protein